MRGKTAQYKCKCCENQFIARTADRKRGWARFCSKRCKAVWQTQRTGRGAPVRKCVESYSRHDERFDVENSFHPFDPYSLGQE